MIKTTDSVSKAAPRSRRTTRPPRAATFIDGPIRFAKVYGPWLWLPGSTVKVLACLMLHRNEENGWSWPRVRTIMAETNLSRSTVYRELTKLEGLGIIEMIDTGGRNEYFVELPVTPKYVTGGTSEFRGRDASTDEKTNEKTSEKNVSLAMSTVPGQEILVRKEPRLVKASSMKRGLIDGEAALLADHLRAKTGRQTVFGPRDVASWQAFADRNGITVGRQIIDEALENRVRLDFGNWTGSAITVDKIVYYEKNHFGISPKLDSSEKSRLLQEFSAK